MGGSRWQKVKFALGLNLCAYLPRTLDDSPPPLNSTERLSDVALLSPAYWDMASPGPLTPTTSSHGFRLSRSSSKSSKMCSICLTKLKKEGGHAIFTAECSHSFHFQCITSNVKHGNQICPVCRAKWKEIPMQRQLLDPHLVGAPVNPVASTVMTVVRRLPSPRRDANHRHVVPLQTSEPGVFDDDEALDHPHHVAEKSTCHYDVSVSSFVQKITIKAYPEVSAVPGNETRDNFWVLVHLKAAATVIGHNPTKIGEGMQLSQNPRAPIDLVTVLDISGSMAGTKLALLKRAMSFVIQNLASSDRLSVIAFSSTARRLFPLQRMSDRGRLLALQAVNSLVANGGTNIAEGLRKGAKVMEDRREKNPVSSIILLSDGQDTYSVAGSNNNELRRNYQSLVPFSVNNRDTTKFQIPVHTFGFGADHDASSMHSISEISGGTFSFIESESAIQDALAQCIGGLLSVAAQELQVAIECVAPELRLTTVKAGSYPSRVTDNGRSGFVDVGDLYAEEERDFLVSVNVPVDASGNGEMPLLKLRCTYKDPMTKDMATLESDIATLRRPEVVGQEVVSVEVDRQRNRFEAAEAMAQARSLAEQGDLTAAVSVLEKFRQVLMETVSAKSHDRFCMALDVELKEMQERMRSRHVYEASGRAYILSGLSSHSWQRATARGDSVDGLSPFRAYQTPSMAEMLRRSQAMLLGSPANHRLVQPLLSPKPW